MADAEEIPTAPWWMWVILVLISAISFWTQATTTEERLVPALNVIAGTYNIPPDIAGATLMAAGASSPELFSSIVALFITHSSLGLGTIVGSEIFNQLIICAGSVYAVKTRPKKLVLDKAIVTREVGFYALGIVLLYVALQDTRPSEDDMGGPEHIFISFWEAMMVFSGYVLYVIVCANMDGILVCVTRASSEVSQQLSTLGGGKTTYGTARRSFHYEGEEYVTEKTNLSDEPVENWTSLDYYQPAVTSSTRGENDNSFGRLESTNSIHRGSLANEIRNSIAAGGVNALKSLVAISEKPSDIHGLHEIQINEFKGTMACFLFQRSVFYTEAYFGSHAWHLRWFSISTERITSVPDRLNPDEHRMRYPRFKAIEIDETRLIINMVNPTEGKRDFTLMAPSRPIFDKVVELFQEYMKHNCTMRPEDLIKVDEEDDADFVDDDADEFEDLVSFPVDGSNVEVVFWFLLFPLRFLMHWTIPDVRTLDENGYPTATVGKAFLATFMCLVWLIVGSYAMVASLEALAALMDIPDAVIGFTVSAAGTSLPNYVASKVAAEKGFGNQAVSNAFGSNTFNIMVGLGLPWALYTASTGFQPYSGLKDEGILESIIILALVLAIFVVFMLISGFVIYEWHGHVFLVLYVSYITYAIARVYVG